MLRKGFDTLAIAVKAQLPPDLFDYLEEQKQIAEAEQRDVLIDWEGVELHLKGHGGSGYRFIASGGPMGANWAFKKPNAKDPWGIRVSFGSTSLATLGLGAAKAHLDAGLNKFGIRTAPEDFSISRVDYCVDILTEGFELDPHCFVMHSSANRRDQVTETDKAVNGRSGICASPVVEMGHRTGRQNGRLFRRLNGWLRGPDRGFGRPVGPAHAERGGTGADRGGEPGARGEGGGRNWPGSCGRVTRR